MSLTGEIVATYRRPDGPIGRLLAGGPREDRALVILMGASAMFFIARAPAMVRDAAADPSVPLEARLGISLFALLFIVPLLAYGLAGLLHLVFGRRRRPGQAWRARTVLFWSLLAISPAMLIQGLIDGFGLSPLLSLCTGLVVFALFLWFVCRGMGTAYGEGAR